MDFVTEHIQQEIEKYTARIIKASSDAEIESIIMTIPEPYRMQVLMGIMGGATGGGSAYKPLDISPYYSLDSMITDLRASRCLGKRWSARDWGTAGELSYYEEKADLLKSWIRLIKILGTLRKSASSCSYTIRLVTDMSGSSIDNTSYNLEVVGSIITLHTNCYYYGSYGKVKVESHSDKGEVLSQLLEDTSDIVKNLSEQYFCWNQTNSDCPSSRLKQIHNECISLAKKM